MTEKWLKDLPLESPSEGFTDKLMEKISMMPVPVRSSYRPLIPKIGWMLLVLVVGASIIAAYYFNLQPLGIFEEVNIWNGIFETGKISFIPKMDWSNPWVYATVAFGILMFVQFRLLKPILENRILA